MYKKKMGFENFDTPISIVNKHEAKRVDSMWSKRGLRTTVGGPVVLTISASNKNSNYKHPQSFLQHIIFFV